MIVIWIDAQLSPSLALWINQKFNGIEAKSVRSLGLREARDKEIFSKAKENRAIIMTKDDDFLQLLEIHQAPPQVIWISCGNTSNRRMRDLLEKHLHTALNLLQAGNSLVEISDK
jgi:predicted nuclease of predicted toxin-antitoxin system